MLLSHETVMESLNAHSPEITESIAEATPPSELGARIERLFAEERMFLNPNLKIADVAAAAGSNRTYVSAYFNREASATFYDYVNSLRINYACRLLRETSDSVKMIAEKSGYNSPQTFIRVFSKIMGVSPSDYSAKSGF